FIPYLKEGVFVTLCAPVVINNDPFLEHMFRIHTHAQCTIFTKTYIVPARQPVLPEEDTGLQSEREKDTKFAHNVCDLLH
ncbi:hypothetical protein, partial [Methanosarcina mazei]